MSKHSKISLGKMVGTTMRAMKKILHKDFEESGCPISAEQFIILRIISTIEDVSQQECADLLSMDKSLFLRKIDVLQNYKLLKRIPDKNDKRKNQLTLTKKGFDILQECEAVEQQTFRFLINGVSEKEYQAFAKVLSVIRENASKKL